MRLNELEQVVLLWGLPSNNGIGEIKEQTEADRDLHILVPEMRPHCLGLEVAKRLNKEDIKHTYATDNMLGILFYKNKVKEVLFCYKKLTDHEIIGICGSLYVCLLAHIHNVPIKPLQGNAIIRSAQTASLLDEHMCLQSNDVLKAADEYIPLDVIQ